MSTYYNNSIRTRYSLDVIVKVLKTKDAKTHISDNNINETDINGNIINEGINFLMCNTCFWCASIYSSIYSNTSSISSIRCPRCYNNDGLESMPICKDESFRINYNPKTGVVLEFL
jgi:hypothetical protein